MRAHVRERTEAVASNNSIGADDTPGPERWATLVEVFGPEETRSEALILCGG
jgi:hypothetical protein